MVKGSNVFTCGPRMVGQMTNCVEITRCNTSPILTIRGRNFAPSTQEFMRPTPILKRERGRRSRLKLVATKANLYVNGARQPSLVVNDLKIDDSRGQVALWSPSRRARIFQIFVCSSERPRRELLTVRSRAQERQLE